MDDGACAGRACTAAWRPPECTPPVCTPPVFAPPVRTAASTPSSSIAPRRATVRCNSPRNGCAASLSGPGTSAIAGSTLGCTFLPLEYRSSNLESNCWAVGTCVCAAALPDSAVAACTRAAGAAPTPPLDVPTLDTDLSEVRVSFKFLQRASMESNSPLKRAERELDFCSFGSKECDFPVLGDFSSSEIRRSSAYLWSFESRSKASNRFFFIASCLDRSLCTLMTLFASIWSESSFFLKAASVWRSAWRSDLAGGSGIFSWNSSKSIFSKSRASRSRRSIFSLKSRSLALGSTLTDPSRRASSLL